MKRRSNLSHLSAVICGQLSAVRWLASSRPSPISNCLRPRLAAAESLLLPRTLTSMRLCSAAVPTSERPGHVGDGVRRRLILANTARQLLPTHAWCVEMPSQTQASAVQRRGWLCTATGDTHACVVITAADCRICVWLVVRACGVLCASLSRCAAREMMSG
jgi:hypothetical protein